MGKEKTILGVRWFTGRSQIGLVLMNNGYEDKAYIGSIDGFNYKEDVLHVLHYGVKFPVEQAKQLVEPLTEEVPYE